MTNQATRKATRSKKPLRQNRPLSTGSQFRKVAKENISVDVDGTKARLSLWEAYVRQVDMLSLTKIGFANLLNRYRKLFPGDIPPGDPITFVGRAEDAML